MLTISDATLVEGGDGATGKMRFTVSTFPTSDTELTATWTTSSEQSDNATADVDYTTATGTVRIAPNTQSDTFEIDILGDNTPEFDETFTVTISAPSAGARIIAGGNTGTGTITNDDGTGLSIEAVSLIEGADTVTSQHGVHCYNHSTKQFRPHLFLDHLD